MVFNSDVFLLAFLPVVYILFWTLRSKQARYVLLSAAGYVFYGWWDYRYCFLLLFSSVVSYLAGIAIDRAPTPGERRRWMIAAISVDLALLGVFKYYDFFASSISALAPAVSLPLAKLALPVGISFYTFHTISYVVDVQRGAVKATHNLFEYLTYVNLFSQLVAGPIVRFRQIEADLEAIDSPPREEWTAKGLGFFATGLIKKVIVADRIAALIDPMLASYDSMGFLQSWVAALGYTCQLYFDFSGYSDMAVGLGYLFGLRIPQNFNAPYRAAGISDFWRRWHISLSSWLRDYLYIPLGGSRNGELRTHVNLLITMLLGGLWHGANWTFIVWGGYHGLLLIADRAAGGLFRKMPRLLYQVQTFFFVVIGWVMFRSTDLEMARFWLTRMFTPDSIPLGTSLLSLWGIAVALVAICFVPETWDIRFPTARRWAPVYAAALLAAYFFLNGRESVFLYYQF